MGLNSPALKYILSRSKKYNFKGPVLTFGNQDIYADINSINSWAKEYKIKKNKFTNVLKSTSTGLKNINSQSQNFIHAKTFFNVLGIKDKDYYDVDKFDFDKPKILHDLEKPLNKKYKKFFNLIVDSGTLEHIFDIKSVMSNTINITKLGGYVLQFIPTNNFLNHGFYQINPTFFYDFYTANGFKVIESYIVEFKGSGYRFHNYNQKSFNTFFVNPYSRLATLFLVKKTKSVKEIITPTQYAYQQELIKLNKIVKPKIFDKFTDFLRRLLPFNYHSFFYIFWVFYKQIFSQKKYFDIPY
jgi:hypothetical protein